MAAATARVAMAAAACFDCSSWFLVDFRFAQLDAYSMFWDGGYIYSRDSFEARVSKLLKTSGNTGMLEGGGKEGVRPPDFGPALTARPPRFLAPRITRPSRFSDLATCLINKQLHIYFFIDLYFYQDYEPPSEWHSKL